MFWKTEYFIKVQLICANLFPHDVEGIELDGETYKLSLYADNAILFLNKSKDTIRKVLDIFRWYKMVSGFVINIDRPNGSELEQVRTGD